LTTPLPKGSSVAKIISSLVSGLAFIIVFMIATPIVSVLFAFWDATSAVFSPTPVADAFLGKQEFHTSVIFVVIVGVVISGQAAKSVYDKLLDALTQQQ
jgi:phosphotransferase system  glucose/maltose/N-acetylglucosamine-specific IIC component